MTNRDANIWNSRIYVNGWREAHGGTVDVIEKATGATLGRIGLADKTDVDHAARGATAAQAAWAASSPNTGRKKLRS
jgi:benzaldehyde dehydrogenase (NAD)